MTTEANTDGPNTPSAPGRGGRTIEQALADVRNDAEALELRRNGASYRAIAQAQGCATSIAFERVKRAIAAHVPRESVEEYRKLSAERLEATIGALLRIIGDIGEVPDVRLAAVGNLVRVEDRLAKLLGADTPVEQKVRVRRVDDLDARIEELVAQLGQRDRA